MTDESGAIMRTASAHDANANAAFCALREALIFACAWIIVIAYQQHLQHIMADLYSDVLVCLPFFISICCGLMLAFVAARARCSWIKVHGPCRDIVSFCYLF